MTTITAPATPWTLLDAALHTRQPVWVTYHGRQRLICPHALGWKNHRPMVLGFQTGGETSSGRLDPDPRKRWRCIYIDEIDDITQADPTSPWASADNYNPSQPFPFPVTDPIAIP